MKKIITIALCLVLMLALGTAMIGCGGECAHSDADGDGKITAVDLALINAAQLKKTTLTWNTSQNGN